MKKILAIALLYVTIHVSLAQDTLYTKGNRTILCKIIKDDSTALHYKNNNNPDLVFRILKKDLLKYSYASTPPEKVLVSVDTISIVKVNRKKCIKYKNGYLSKNSLGKMLEHDPNAGKAYQSSEKNHKVAQTLGGIGGFLMGYPIGYALFSGKFDIGIFGAGVGIACLSIPFEIRSNNKYKEAIHIYNDNIKYKTTSNLDFKLGWSGNSVKATLTF